MKAEMAQKRFVFQQNIFLFDLFFMLVLYVCLYNCLSSNGWDGLDCFITTYQVPTREANVSNLFVRLAGSP